MIQPAAPGGSHAAATGPTPPKAQIKNTNFSLSSFGEKGKIGDQQCTKWLAALQTDPTQQGNFEP